MSKINSFQSIQIHTLFFIYSQSNKQYKHDTKNENDFQKKKKIHAYIIEQYDKDKAIFDYIVYYFEVEF
jgi:hypothetical protein